MTEKEAKEQLGIIPTAKDIFGRRAEKFCKLASELREINEAKAQLEKEGKALGAKLIAEYWSDCDYKTLIGIDGEKITRVQSSNSSISKQALLELGVEASIILKATKSTSYEYVKVTVEKE